ncbi:DUF3089 domain-containing protein [Rhodococcus triatomae]|uniref:DUF3089 domain-containing protein n=1 Tax=Rhodococcus triatomae TaxID=300028 RepID=A0A1G8NBB8_9NOCA|nr:DUF3089 domain-containing protein [Rhodococcus triatomae]QNG19956.1 DUF3089 domain-containing protein [Rhodococcus triatomae]QNG24129.1 DUF3089 domain-containing protein [Rhodococcus triatomae]SDI77415.1 Protein of unknown function [Rhodococcus triatomae]
MRTPVRARAVAAAIWSVTALVLGGAVVTTVGTSNVAPSAAAEPEAPRAADTDTTEPPPDTTTWLCRPSGPDDPCGGRSGAPIDCFYVYPTVSLQPTPNATLDATPEVRGVAALQAAPFGEHCNVWAPVYRQSTLQGLASPPGPERAAALDVAYDDIDRAWSDYLAHHNDGRGVVLIGHSQGTRMLRTLVHNRIDGKPAQSQLVSALLIGGDVLVRKGESTGGDFDSVPACTDSAQIGCVVAYSAFSAPPPPDTRYGLPPQVPGLSGTRADLPYGPGYEVLCTNPASLRDNHDAPIHGFGPGRGTTEFSARCTEGDGPNVLMVGGPGADLLPALPSANWGLHAMDLNLAQRTLVDLVGAQSAAYSRP